MNNEPKASMSIDSELLAAYIDNRLSPDERAAVEAQLASDPDSYAVLVDTLKAQDGLGDGRVVTPTTRRSWVIAATTIAAAAVIAIVVWTPRRDGTVPAFERLVVAAADARYTEARLTGGFHFGPSRPIRRGSEDASRGNVALLAAASELEREAQKNPSAENLHAWGVAQLMIGDVAGSIQTLESAASSSTAGPEIYSDLSGAYLERALRLNTEGDLQRALNFSDRALAGSRRPLEALFNRAIILSRMGRRQEAIAAWNDYINADPSSAWSQYARQRLQEL
jgi:hypothetical protein